MLSFCSLPVSLFLVPSLFRSCSLFFLWFFFVLVFVFGSCFSLGLLFNPCPPLIFGPSSSVAEAFFWVLLESLFPVFCSGSSPPPPSALLCSAFYRAREPQNQSCLCRTVIQITNGIVGRRRGPRFAADFLLNRLSPCETKGMMNSASKRRRLCPWEWLFCTLAPKRFKLNNWDLNQ